jgi:hypothetical protein
MGQTLTFSRNDPTGSFKIILIFETGRCLPGLAHRRRHSVVGIAPFPMYANAFSLRLLACQWLEEEVLKAGGES